MCWEWIWPVVAIERARKPDSDRKQSAPVDPALLQQVVDQPNRRLEASLHVSIDVERHLLLGQDGVREVGDRRPQVIVAEVQAHEGPAE